MRLLFSLTLILFFIYGLTQLSIRRKRHGLNQSFDESQQAQSFR
jgi:flagellar biogenesis protein FliO